jgi:hypothetical protein
LTAWPFLLFSIVFVALVCAHFLPSYRTWRSTRGEHPADIDPDYIRMEDYFARSFRFKMSEWLKLPVYETMPGGTRMIRKGDERIRLTGHCEYPAESKSDEILAVQGDFRCGTNCAFNREIHVRGDAFVGAGTRLQSIAVDGNLVLGAGVMVTRWADSSGEMEIGSNAVVRARATSGTLIRMGRGARVGSAFAPIVTTSTAKGEDETGSAQPVQHRLEIPGPGGEASGAAAADKRGFDPKRIHRLGPDSWLYRGDLVSPSPVCVRTRLVVRGDCLLQAGSIVEGDLKARGRVEVGKDSVCQGNVIADREVTFGPSSRFHGVVHTGRTLRLSRGVVGGDKDRRVAAYSAGILLLEENVTVYGKVSSGDHVAAMTGR